MCPASVWAQTESGDTLRGVSLDSVVVKSSIMGRQLRSHIDGKLIWNMEMISNMPKILGTSDPLHYSQMLPGVSVNSEYDAGIRVLGCENGHNSICINGAPVYGAAHLLGVFSVFNPAHFSRIVLTKSMNRAEMPNHIGAFVDMRTSEQMPQKIEGEVTAGMISSAAMISIPTGGKSYLRVSLRDSYVNLLYSGMLENDEMAMRYSFYDANISYYAAGERNSITVDAYLGEDHAVYSGRSIYSDIDMNWGNMMISTGWKHMGRNLSTYSKAYFTRYRSDVDIRSEVITSGVKSSISELGYKGNIRYGDLVSGLDLSYYMIKPQGYNIISSFGNTYNSYNTNHSVELSAYADYRKSFGKHVVPSCGLRITSFWRGSKRYYGCVPSVAVSYINSHGWDVSFDYSCRHQYIVQTGMSDLGSPMEYWLSSGTFGIEPQTGHNFMTVFRYTTSDGFYTFTAEAYLKLLEHQLEYNGTIFSMLSRDYSVEDALLECDGINYGLNVMAMKNRGAVTGWVSYAYSPTKRKGNTAMLEGTFHSSHERLHELKAVASMKIGNRTDMGAVAVYATGNPYTRPLGMMVLGNHVLPIYSKKNNARLSPYFRIDLSANYCLKRTSNMEHSVNLSVYNCTGRKNDLFQYVHADTESFYFRSMKNIMRVIPSVSYTLKFR